LTALTGRTINIVGIRDFRSALSDENAGGWDVVTAWSDKHGGQVAINTVAFGVPERCIGKIQHVPPWHDTRRNITAGTEGDAMATCFPSPTTWGKSGYRFPE
jgi:hypothetical protein